MFASYLLAIALSGQTSAPRVFERLPNDAQIYAERIEDSDRISVQLWISSRGTEERPATNGYRHLIEHFLAKSQDRFTDENGIFLAAETSRESMAFKVEAAPEKLGVAIACLKGLFQPLKLTPEAIAKEIQIIRHEAAGVPSSRLFSRAAWDRAFGGKRPDPMGDFEVMAKATPDELEAMRRKMFASSNLVVTACGAVEPTAVISLFRQFLVTLPVAPAGITSPEPEIAPAELSVGTQGSGISVKLEGIDRASSLARIAAGLAISQAIQGVQLTYTVSQQSGLMTLSSGQADLSDAIASMSERQLAAGQSLILRWVDGIQRVPTRLASLRGALLAEGSTVTVAQLRKSAAAISFEDLQRAHREILAGIKLEGF